MFVAWIVTVIFFLVCVGSAIIVEDGNRRIDLILEKDNAETAAVRQLAGRH